MSVTLEFLNNLSAKDNNFIIFVSKISDLKSVNLPFSLDNYIKNKVFVNNLNSNKYTELNILKTDSNEFFNIKISLVNLSSESCIDAGSSIFSNFRYNEKTTINFVFLGQLKINKNYSSEIVFGFLLKSYNFDKYFSENDKKIQDINIKLLKLKNMKDVNYLINLSKSINYCKDLVSEPANILNPISYSQKCKELSKIGLKIKILNQKDMKKIGMHSLLGVSTGSDNEPRVVIFEWNLNKKNKPTVLVGKGVTFDTGGISLKSPSGMEEMITDMAGSAVVVGSMMNAALNKSKKSLIGIIGLVENMPDGKSQRPGDIITSLSGQSIEVLNTDAEGRLVLADIITYIQNNYNPKEIIDFATLTGAIMIALGTHRAGIFSNNDILSKKLENAGEISGERLWRLPLGNEYDNEINSLRADMKNIGSTRFGGSIHAAQFIKRFIKNNIPWAHIDIAGVSWTMKSGQNSFSKLHSPGATAFGVRLINQFLKGR